VIVDDGDVNNSLADGIGDMQAKKENRYEIEKSRPDNGPAR
jgi:hypothetical protein